MSKIETLDDWNARLSCCCPMPSCPMPELEVEAVDIDHMRLCGEYPIAGDFFGVTLPPEALLTAYQRQVYILDEAHTDALGVATAFHRDTTVVHKFLTKEEVCDFTSVVNESGTGGCPYSASRTHVRTLTGGVGGFVYTDVGTVPVIPLEPLHSYVTTETIEFANPILDNLAYLRAQAETIFTKRGFAGANGSSLPLLEVLQVLGPNEKPVVIRWVKSRFRWKVPALLEYDGDGNIVGQWEGKRFKITWDVIFYPANWDATIDDPDYVPPEDNDPPEPIPQIPDPDAKKPVVVEKDRTVKWTGPGKKDNADSWVIDGWSTLEAPTEPGHIEFRNIRFECYGGPYGSKPQLMGEGYEE